MQHRQNSADYKELNLKHELQSCSNPRCEGQESGPEVRGRSVQMWRQEVRPPEPQKNAKSTW